MPSPDEQAAEMARPPLIVILGPTAVGKTALSLDLAVRFDGEIVGADSRQIYLGMDIGTAKPSAEEQARVPHHLIDVQPPDRHIALATYQQMAFRAIDAIHRRGRVPFLVGGSALYLRAVTEGLQIPEVAPNPRLRTELETFAQEKGRASLHARLQAMDPSAAARIHPNNLRRVIRALEIVQTTGRRKSDWNRQRRRPIAFSRSAWTCRARFCTSASTGAFSKWWTLGWWKRWRRCCRQAIHLTYRPSPAWDTRR